MLPRVPTSITDRTRIFAHISISAVVVLLGSQAWSSGYYNVSFGFKPHATQKLAITTLAQNNTAALCSSAVTIQTQDSGGAAANVGSDLTVNLTGSGFTFFSDADCTIPISSIIVSAGTNTSNIYFTGSSAGSASLQAAATGYSSISQTETFTANSFIWTGGGGDAYWGTAGNWSGGAAPGSSNTAIFDGTCSSNCSPTINGSLTIGGIRMNSGYTGTITQSAGVSIQLTTTGWYQAAGTFVGGTALIENDGAFGLSGGSFKSTSGTFDQYRSWAITNSPTFNANSGTLLFDRRSDTADVIPGTVNYNNVSFLNSGCDYDSIYNLGGGTIKVYGALAIRGRDGCQNAADINSGTIMAYGDVSNLYWGGAGSAVIQLAGNASGQTITGDSDSVFPSITIEAGSNPVTLSGTLNIAGSYIVSSSGTFTATGSSIQFQSDGTNVFPGTGDYNNVTFNAWACSYDTHFNLGGGTFNVKGALSFKGRNGCYTTAVVDSGTIMAYGNISNIDGGGGGSAVVQVAGNVGGQTITGDPSSGFPAINIAAGANAVTLSGTVVMYGNYTMTSVGTFTSTGSTLFFLINGISIIPGTVNYNNVTFSNSSCGSDATYTLNGGTINVQGTLTLKGRNGCGNTSIINSGTLKAYGDVTATDLGSQGSATLTFAGSTGQTLSAASCLLPSGNVTVAKTGGSTLTLASAVSWNNTGQSLTVTSGSVAMAGNALTVNSLSLGGNTLTKSSGVLTVNGSVVGTGSLYGGTVSP